MKCFLPRLLWEETPGGPAEGGAGEGPGTGRAVHRAVQLPDEEVRGEDVQHLLPPGSVQQAVRLGVIAGQQHRKQGRHLPRSDGT